MDKKCDFNQISQVPTVSEVAEDIYCISVPLPSNPLKELNSYLIRGENQSLLIDTGFRQPACRDALWAGLESLGCARETMDIFLTHLHADHSGLAPDLIHPSRNIYISSVDLEWVYDREIFDDGWGDIRRRFLEAGMPEDIAASIYTDNPAILYAPSAGCGNYVGVQHDDAICIGRYEFCCILTPGHTPGHMCLWDEQSGILFTGDHVLFDITPNIMMWNTLPDSLGIYLDSLTRVRQLPVRLALPSHRTTGNFVERVDALEMHHQDRMEECLSIVLQFPSCTAYEIAGKMTWKIRAKNWDEFPPAQKIFALGECLAHLDHLLAQKKITISFCTGIGHYFAT